MSIAVVACRAQLGMLAPLVEVEVSLAAGLPVFNIVGLPMTVVKESKDRVRSALVHSGFDFPAGRITVNLSPADIPKRGGRFDLPIALGILLASGQLRIRGRRRGLAGIEFYGELGLAGELKATPGLLLAAAHAARDQHEMLVPQASALEVGLILRSCGSAAIIRTADHLLSVCAHLDATKPLPALTRSGWNGGLSQLGSGMQVALDLRDVRGQLQAKRALTVAAAGQHSLLMIGPPGVGKTMLALRLPGLLPALTEAEALEVAAITSASGLPFHASSFGCRPLRTPHHTASAVALIGGGARARPGEITLAHRGVLFLDELLEYDRRALEALREPLESGQVCVSRAALQAQYPAEFQLVAAMNPCPCGRYGDPLGQCICTPGEIARYRNRISAPLLERLDIQLEVPRVDPTEFGESELRGESSEVTARRVKQARQIQLARQDKCNARLEDSLVDRVCALDRDGRDLLELAMRQLMMSARARQRILKVARTIADLEGRASISMNDVSEAVTYRSLDRRPEFL